MGFVVRDFSGDETASAIFVIGDCKKVRLPEAAYNPPPSSLWLVGGHVRKLSDIVYVEVAELGRESKWKGYQLIQSKRWIELIEPNQAVSKKHGLQKRKQRRPLWATAFKTSFRKFNRQRRERRSCHRQQVKLCR
ncbi:MAG: hypothetical protein NZ805_15795 [Armatimonadetes bacterium]|nr:hypothetical protein [Armatimonadota bacterium]MDW8029934.1 hypothetical protein [Armatimonadota bacterium]